MFWISYYPDRCSRVPLDTNFEHFVAPNSVVKRMPVDAESVNRVLAHDRLMGVVVGISTAHSYSDENSGVACSRSPQDFGKHSSNASNLCPDRLPTLVPFRNFTKPCCCLLIVPLTISSLRSTLPQGRINRVISSFVYMPNSGLKRVGWPKIRWLTPTGRHMLPYRAKNQSPQTDSISH